MLDEADLDEDGWLSYTEFEHVISRAPEFLRYATTSLPYSFEQAYTERGCGVFRLPYVCMLKRGR